MYKVISQCPVCGGRLKVIKLKCDKCDTVIENDFRLNKFDYLSEQELFFIETFIRCRGNIKEVEKLGYKPAPSPDNKKKEILDALERGEITPEEALEQMK